jgi:hypothetical protein
MAPVAVWENMYLYEPMMKECRNFIEIVSSVFKPVLSVSEELTQVVQYVLLANTDICV